MLDEDDEELDARDLAIIFAGRIRLIEGNPPVIMQVVNAIESAILYDRQLQEKSTV